MVFKRTVMRYAHTNGHTNCTYTTDGELIITCGSDGDIRTWQCIDDDDPSSKCLGEFLLSLVQYDGRLLVSTDFNVVQAYTFPQLDKDGTEFRFTAPATCIKVNKKFIAAGSEDTEIKVVKRDGNEGEFQLLGHEGPILHIDLSVKDLLASSSGDGSLKIWDLNEKKEIKTLSGFPKVKSFDAAKLFCSPAFEPKTGKSLVYTNGKQITVLNCNTWELQFVLTDDDITSEYSFCSFSPCGQFLAAGTQSGEISVWDFTKKETLSGERSSTESEGITAISWNPKNNGEFAYCDSTGQLGTVTGCKTDRNEPRNHVVNEVDEDLESDFDGVQFKDDDEDDLDNENCFSLGKIKNETMKANGVIDDDDDNAKETDERSISPTSVNIPRYKSYTEQESFQPSATPKDLEHRYLVWNNVGIVRSHAGDGEGSIDIEFHDVSTHHALHMNNYSNHTMASLSSTALALCGDASSRLVCITLGTSGSREWSIELPDCEGILAIAATNKLIAVATDNRFLRIFSVMGTQREVISLPGPVVAMSGLDDKLMIVYHSAPASEDQHMSAMILQIMGLSLRCREIRIPLARGKKLTWVGYSDRGSPVCCDNMGLVHMFNMKTSCWYPVCDTMKHTSSVSNNFFIIDVSEKNQIIQAVLCRSSSYPMTNPRPMVTELPLQVPMCEMDSEKSGLEETLLRWSTFNVDNSEKIIKETAIKLFALACRGEVEARAKELIEMIGSPEILPLAVKYASKLGRIHLADKLSELLPQLEEQEREREKQMKDTDVEALTILSSSSLSTSLLLLQQNGKNNSFCSPKIAPKPMVLSNQKRNPFKRSSMSSPIVHKDNPLSHLTDKAIGFEAKRSEIVNENLTPLEQEITQSESSHDETDVIPCSISIENKRTNGNLPTRNFMTWYKENEHEFEKNYPKLSKVELTKLAMNKFKLSLSESKQSPVTMKRKLTEEDSKEKQSGIAKLAKFGCKK